MNKLVVLSCCMIWLISITLSQTQSSNSTSEQPGMGNAIPDSVVKYWETHTLQINYNHTTFPTSIDWSIYDSPVKNQGGCGSPWVFAPVALVENIGRQTDLSEQVILSCITNNFGCGGGWPLDAFKYIHDQGVPPESCYPYTATNGNCSKKCSFPKYFEIVRQYGNVNTGYPFPQVDLMKAALQTGPLVVCMYMFQDFFSYPGGIYHHLSGGGAFMGGHCVLLDGYDDAQQCFKAKNSWGMGWGESGYFRISYSELNDSVQFGTLASTASGAFAMPTELALNVETNWNLISPPFNAANDSVITLFPTCIGDAFSYIGSGYQIENQLSIGKGYWLRFGGATSDTIRGLPFSSDTITVVDGWNLIGSISVPLAVSSITSNPLGMVTSNCFGYNKGYHTTDTLYPGQGYWIKVNQAGSLILSVSTTQEELAKSAIRIVHTDELPPPPPSDAISQYEIPKTFSLSQNYPNPANPGTTISFSLPRSTFVTIKIYNILGQLISTLVNERRAPGTYNVQFDASNLPSGVYYYRLSGGDYVATKSMLVIK